MRGGYRAGAGRKLGASAIKMEEARKYIATEVDTALAPIVAGLIKKAKRGDMRAIQILFDRAYGKAPDAIKNSNELGFHPLQIVISKESVQRYGIGHLEEK